MSASKLLEQHTFRLGLTAKAASQVGTDAMNVLCYGANSKDNSSRATNRERLEIGLGNLICCIHALAETNEIDIERVLDRAQHQLDYHGIEVRAIL